MAMCVSDVKRALDKDRQGRKQLQAELRAATRAYRSVLPDRQAEGRAQVLQVIGMSDWPGFLAFISSASSGHVIKHVTRKQTDHVCMISGCLQSNHFPNVSKCAPPHCLRHAGGVRHAARHTGSAAVLGGGPPGERR